MMENREYFNTLFDIYKDLLTKVEQETFINYYQEDLSLSEIALNRGVSKSSVGKTLKQACDKLEQYEIVLKIKDIKKQLNKLLEIENLNELKIKLEEILSK